MAPRPLEPPDGGGGSERARPARLSGQDTISAGDAVRRAARRLRAWVLCRVGRHVWAVRRNPEVGGPRAVYQQCRRCGRERTDWSLRGTFED
jgi:hypothetical protein